MAKPKLSVVLATYNEEANLDRCLASVTSLADEIVISDGGSTDDTLVIAKKYKAKVYHMPNNPINFHINKNNAIDRAVGEWILQLDADEAVSPELANAIRSAMNHKLSTTYYNGYWMNRKNWFLTRFLTKGGQYPDPTLRLYRQGKGRLPAEHVHEQAKVIGETSHIAGDLLHYRDTSFEKYLDGFNRYSTIVASQLTGRENLLRYIILIPVITFIKIYIRRLGLVDGFPGFIFALFSGLIYPVAYIKHWQQANYPET